MTGNMDHANDTWTGYNHHHLAHVTWMSVEVIITYLLLFVVTAALRLDKGSVDQNSLDQISVSMVIDVLVHDEDSTEGGKEKIFSIKNDINDSCRDTDYFRNQFEDECVSCKKYPEFENQMKVSLKLEPVRAELPDPVYNINDDVCMSFLKHPEDKSETNPKWVCGSKCHLSSLQKPLWKSSETSLLIKDKELQVLFQLNMTATTQKEVFGVETDLKSFNQSNGFKRAQLHEESLLPRSVSCPTKYEDVDSSQVTLKEKGFLETHEDGLHMYFWNDLDFDSLNSGSDDDDDTSEFFEKQLCESSHSCFFKNFTYSENALEEQKNHTLHREKVLPVSDQLMENKNIYISPTENDNCINNVELQGLSKDSMIENKLENTDLQHCQESKICENTLACVDKYKSIMQSEGVESNMTEKSFSDKGIQVGLTETVCCGQMEVGTYHASHENKMVSTPKNNLDSAVTSLDKNKKIKISLKDPLKGNMLHKAAGPDENPQTDSGKFITEKKAENPSNVSDQVILDTSPMYTGCSMMDLTSEQLMLFKNIIIQEPENENQKFKKETSEQKSKYGFNADRKSVVNLESNENEEFFGGTLTHDEDKEDLIHSYNSERHYFEFDNHRKKKYVSQCCRGRMHSRHIEHGRRKRKQYRPPSHGRAVRRGCAARIEPEQYYGKSRAVHIIEKDIMEAMTDSIAVDCRRYQGLEEEHISDCQRVKMDKYGPLNNKKQHLPKVPLIPFQDNLMRKTLMRGSRLIHKENQDQKFKMKKVINTDKCNVKSVSDLGRYAQEKLAIIVRTFFACRMVASLNYTDKQNDSSTFDGKFHKKGTSAWKKLNFDQNAEFHDISELLQELVSTWYFYPIPCRNMEFCLPSSLQACFERLINGPPISLEERMSYEWLRLQSFNTFPTSAQGICVRMAESGFYYTGQGTCTRCYACNTEHEGWNNTDNPHAIHRRISPNCPFLGGNPTYPNFPIIPDTIHNGNNTERSGFIATQSIPVVSRVPESYPQPIVTSSLNPSSTPCLHEMSVSPSASTNGCHQVNSETAQLHVRRENLENQGASVRMKQQQTSSSPSTETSWPESSPRSTILRHPQQPRIDAENAEYMSQGNFVLTLQTRQEEDPGMDPTPHAMSEHPKHPEHAPLSSRINSYTGWPIHLDQTPQQMAEAGFYYAGVMDYTRCFQCGGGLRNWTSGDNPWIEHARWYPECAYVLGKRGQRFVNAVLKKQAELLAAQNTEQNNSGSTTSTNDNNITRSGTGTSESLSAQPQSGQPRYFPNPHENDIAKRLIEEMGYQQERVREAILEVKRIRGQQQITIEHAIDLLLADEERMARAGRQNKAAAMEELIQESGRLTLHEDNNSAPSSSSPVAQTITILTPIIMESYQGSGHPNHFAGGRSSVQQQSGQTKQSTHLGQDSSIVQSRQNISGPVSIAVDVPLSSPFFGNQEGHQNNKSTAGSKTSSSSLLEPASLPALDAESLREEYLRLQDQNKCKLCRERNVELAFLPCGHLVCCEVCGKTLRFCPICQSKIHASVKTYQS